MIIIKRLSLLLFLVLGTIRLTAQECPPAEGKDAQKEISAVPGETMGQKLESLLFWTQEERSRRFAMMQDLFPSIQISTGNHNASFQEVKSIVPQWNDNTTLKSYMDDNHVQGIIVIQDDKIKMEKYAEGVNEETLWTSFSVAKSISSMLLGVALKDGAIESLEDPLKKYIPEFEGHNYGEVTVRQLLTMTSGIGWNEDYVDANSDVAQMYQRPCVDSEDHILTYMKPLKFAHQPGTHWNYSTGETDLVGILIQKATGKSLAEYLSEKIWKPFGMEHCAYWLADECSNLNIGGSGLSASLRDFARLGTVMLKEGKVGEADIFSQEWLESATSQLYDVNEEGDGYGYLWWRFKNGSYAAVGIFGQMIYVNPDKNLVIAQTAAWPKAGSPELSAGRQTFIDAVLIAID